MSIRDARYALHGLGGGWHAVRIEVVRFDVTLGTFCVLCVVRVGGGGYLADVDIEARGQVFAVTV